MAGARPAFAGPDAALAVLLAPHFPESRAVLTFAANLDLGAWSPLPVRVVERH